MNQMKSEMRLMRVGRLLLMWCIIQLFHSLLILIRHPENPWTTCMVRVSGGTFFKVQASMFFSQLTYICRGSKSDTIKGKINGSNELLRKREEFCFGQKKGKMEEFMKCIYMGKNHAPFLSGFFFSFFLFFLYQFGHGWFFFFFLFCFLSLTWILCLCSSIERTLTIVFVSINIVGG